MVKTQIHIPVQQRVTIPTVTTNSLRRSLVPLWNIVQQQKDPKCRQMLQQMNIQLKVSLIVITFFNCVSSCIFFSKPQPKLGLFVINTKFDTKESKSKTHISSTKH